jgi:hypothetical protein
MGNDHKLSKGGFSFARFELRNHKSSSVIESDSIDRIEEEFLFVPFTRDGRKYVPRFSLSIS